MKMVHRISIAMIALSLMHQRCTATTVIEPSATIDTASASMELPSATVVPEIQTTAASGVEAASISSTSSIQAMTASPSQSITGTITPTSTASSVGSMATPVPEGGWEKWIDNCYPDCCKMEYGWKKEYNMTRNCPRNRRCSPDDLGHNNYKTVKCPGKCDKCNSGMVAKPLFFPLVMSALVLITSYLFA